MEIEITRLPFLQVEDGDLNHRAISLEHGPNSLPISELLTRVANHERGLELMKTEEQHKTMMKKCKPPISRKFGHPCNCGSSSNNPYLKQRQEYFQINSQHANGSESLPSIAYGVPMYLYDPSLKKCLPTSRSRDMLLRDCHPNGLLMANFHMRSQPPLPQSGPCYYSDLVCDPRRYRCVCKQPNLHLYYSSDSSPSSFGCVPLNHSRSIPNQCRQGQFYSVISRECQKIFDPLELPLSPTANTTATQMSFASIVLIWIFLLIVILVAKLRKLKRNALYGSGAPSPQFERRSHNHYHYQPSSSGGPNSLHRHRSRATSAWLHPFMAAVNGHHYLSHHRAEHLDNEHSQHRDTDVFLGQSRRRFNEIMSTGRNFSGSDLSIDTPPPPKFDEIYPPSCRRSSSTDGAPDPPPAINQHTAHQFQPPPNPPPVVLPLPSNDDLPTYEEAMKMDDTATKNQKETSAAAPSPTETRTTSQTPPPHQSSTRHPITTTTTSTTVIINDNVDEHNI